MKRVVLGNGIIGLATAFGLVQKTNPSDVIVLVGPRERPGSATLAAAAMLNSFAEIDAGGLDHPIDAARFAMSRRAAGLWPGFEKQVLAAAEHPTIGKSELGGGELGTYVINNTATDDLDDENFDAIVDALKAFDEAYSLASPSDIPGYKPQQSYRATRAIYIENEGWYNPRLMVRALERALELSGKVIFHDAAVRRLTTKAGTVSHVTLEDGTNLDGDQFLLATGATATDILGHSEIDLNVQRVFFGIGTSIEIYSPDAPLEKVVRTPNRGLACGIYAAPNFQGLGAADHTIIGASNFISPTLQNYGRLTSVETLLQGAMRQINSDYYRADLVRVNVGARPTSQDTYPMLGPTSIKNLFIATGTKRDGFHLAPLLCEIMSDLMMGRSDNVEFDIFRPERKPLRTLTRQQAIDKAVRHQINAAYQHGFVPAANRMIDQIRQKFRDDLETLHDKVGAVDWGIQPEMLDMYRYGHARP